MYTTAVRRLHPAVALAAACGGPTGESGPIRHADRMALWSEYPGDVGAEAGFAAANELNLNLAIARDADGRDFLRAHCDAAAEADVQLVLWPILPEDEGYWPNQGNHAAFRAWVDTLVAWAAGDCPRLAGVVVDMEYPLDRITALQEMIAGGAPVLEIVQYLVDGIDATAFEEARAAYADLVEELRAAGLGVGVTTLPMIADDWEDGDETLAQMFWTPVEGIDWDYASFQVYRSLYDAEFAALTEDPEASFTSGLVTSYAETIVEKFGERAGVDLGTTGAGIGIEEGLASSAEMQADVAAALAAGIGAGRVAIYSLEGVIDRADAADWLAVPDPAAAEVCPATDQVRGTFAVLDAVAD